MSLLAISTFTFSNGLISYRTNFLSEDVKINPTKLDSYFSFMQGPAAAGNNKLFIPIAIGIATTQKWNGEALTETNKNQN
jgi:hypothetical protein